MLATPRVSIIIPIHNSLPHLRSMARQLEPYLSSSCEILLVDDGSSDGGGEFLKSFAAGRPSVRLLRLSSSHGVARARNIGLEAARGEYVWFADDDDLWSPSILEVFLEAARRSDADIVVCRAEHRFPGSNAGNIIDGLDCDKVVSSEEAWRLVLEGAVHGYLWNKLFKRSVLGIDPFEPVASQSDFTGLVRAVAKSSRVHFVPDLLYVHLIHAGSITRRSKVDLGNLECAYRIAMRIDKEIPGHRDPSLLAYFRAWFLVLPHGHTPTRVQAHWSIRWEGLRKGCRLLQGVNLSDVRVRSRRIHRKLWLMSNLGGLYLVLLHCGQLAKRLYRKVSAQ